MLGSDRSRGAEAKRARMLGSDRKQRRRCSDRKSERRKMMRYTEFAVWKLAHELTLNVYAVTCHFPSDEKYGLVSQLRRACVSVEANLAEGSNRATDADFARFVNISEGSIAEVDVLLKISFDVGYFKNTDDGLYQTLKNSVGDVARLLRAFHKTLKAV
jgi:four helix bundle protein